MHIYTILILEFWLVRLAIVSFFLYCFTLLCALLFFFRGKRNGDLPAPTCCYFSACEIFLVSFLVEIISVVLEGVILAKTPKSFAAVKVLIECTFFVLSSFLALLVGSQGCFMFLLELLMEEACSISSQSRPCRKRVDLELIASSGVAM